MTSVQIIALIALRAIAAIGVWLWTPDLPRDELESRYAERPEDCLDVLGIRLHVRDRGPWEALALLMLHGFGSSLHTWQPWADALAADMRVVSLDLPGAGLSAADPDAGYSDERSLEILLALLDRLKSERLSLLGNALGGRTLALRGCASGAGRSSGADLAGWLCQPGIRVWQGT